MFDYSDQARFWALLSSPSTCQVQSSSLAPFIQSLGVRLSLLKTLLE